MKRRRLLQAIASLPATCLAYKGAEAGRAYEVKADKKYLVFLNGYMVDADGFCNDGDCVLPPDTPVHVVHPNSQQTLDDAIRIYEVS